jgi:hypothetical protein
MGEWDAMKRTEGATLRKGCISPPGCIQGIFAVEPDQAIETGLRLLTPANAFL